MFSEEVIAYLNVLLERIIINKKEAPLLHSPSLRHALRIHHQMFQEQT